VLLVRIVSWVERRKAWVTLGTVFSHSAFSYIFTYSNAVEVGFYRLWAVLGGKVFSSARRGSSALGVWYSR